MAVADFNGDERPDLAALAGTGVAVHLALGNGGFAAPLNTPTTAIPTSVAAADFNADGKADLALANQNAYTVTILLGTGTGSFGTPRTLGGVQQPMSLAVADFNADGKADVAVANAASTTVSVFLGTGTGDFASATPFPAGPAPAAVAVADFNADGAPDLVVANNWPPGVSILLGTGTGTFQPPNGFPVYGVPYSVVVSDFNRDGKADVAASRTNGPGHLSVFLGTGTGSLGPEMMVGNLGDSGSSQALVAGDFNGDENPDLAVATGQYNSVAVLLGKGTGAFRSAVSLAAGRYAFTALAGDLNGDGKTDLAATNLDSNDVSVFLNTCLCRLVTPGIADGTFESGAPWSAWTTQMSTQFGTPLCNLGLCGDGAGTAPPYAGDNWAWFGGTPYVPETAALGQSVFMPVSSDLRLRFQMRIGATTAPATDSLVVSVDGVPVATFAEPTVAEPAYSQREVDLTGFASGASHGLTFSYFHPHGGVANFTVDDIELLDCVTPALSIGDVTVTEGYGGPVDAVFAVTLSSAGDRTVTMQYATVDETAIAGTDYVQTSGTVTFPPGATTSSLRVPVLNDVAYDPNETFAVNLSSPVNGRLRDGHGRATILDESSPVELFVTKTDGHVSARPGQPLTYTITGGNAGPNATLATISDVFPPSLNGVTWSCTGTGGASCPSAGTADINHLVDLPVGGMVTYTVNATVTSNPSSLTNTVTVTPPAGIGDTNLASNAATDSDVLVCADETAVVADGRIGTGMIAPGAVAWYGASLRLGGSYSVEFKNVDSAAPAPGELMVFRGDDGCSGTSSLAVVETGTIDPVAAPGTVRVSFTASGSDSFYRMRLVNSSSSPVSYVFSVSETTQYSAVWSTNGGFDTYYSLQNTTATTLEGTLVLLDLAGAAVATVPVTVLPNATAGVNTLSLGLTRNRTGTARFTHDGPPGAVVVEAAIANFALNPAYVQPVKFQTVREQR